MEKINRVILCKYGEVALKGANRPRFETMLLTDLRHRAKRIGSFNIYTAQSTVYIEPSDFDACDADEMTDAMFEEVKRTFGFSGICIAAVTEKSMEAVKRTAAEYLPQFFSGASSFRAQAKRSDKRFPLKSPEIAAEVGAAILEAMPQLRVDLSQPDITVTVEIRERGAYIHAGQLRGAGGMPLGSSGRGLLLLSGGIDSPVAGYMMMRRGVSIEAVHFESFPYTSERAREKVFSLASILSRFGGFIRVHVISVTHIQEQLRDLCDEDYFTLLLRRFMMALSERTALHCGAKALITGESLAQVASQTMEALAVTDCVVSMPVFRPCIGMDKEDIIELSRKIDAFETSILPYEDCCTVFTPSHPRTRPELSRVMAQEEKIDFTALCDEAFHTRRVYHIIADRTPGAANDAYRCFEEPEAAL